MSSEFVVRSKTKLILRLRTPNSKLRTIIARHEPAQYLNHHQGPFNSRLCHPHHESFLLVGLDHFCHRRNYGWPRCSFAHAPPSPSRNPSELHQQDDHHLSDIDRPSRLTNGIWFFL